MRELSLHILDIIQNSISAEASLIELVISEDTSQDRLVIEIIDNGCGLEATTNALDPFWTSRNTREVGLGLPLFQAAAERCGGDFNLESTPQQGTKVEAIFQLSHIDRAPLGDIAGTLLTCITSNPEVDFVYHHQVDEASFEFDTREIRAELGSEVALDNRKVVAWMEKYLTNNLNQLRG